MVPRGSVEIWGSLVLLVHQARRATQGNQVFRGCRVSWGCRGSKVTWGREERPALKDARGSEAEMESLGLLVYLAKWDPWEGKERQE